jgi:enterochelin esterase-like enzyme
MKTSIFLSFSCLILLLSCSSDVNNKKDNSSVSDFKTGTYTHASFQSKERGKVAFNVYLPPNWSKDNAKEYPLMILLHGQGEDEFTFLSALPDSSLNYWIKKQILPEDFVLIALRGGENTNEMQWYSDPNEAMISSSAPEELRAYCHKNFHTSMESSKISVLGHSRGATGALNFALYFPDKFSAVVSSAFVSDYAIERLKQATEQNLDAILRHKPFIHMLIGSKDQYVLNNNRKGSPTMSAFFESKGIQHQFKVIENKSHRLSELWAYPTNLYCLQICIASWK